MNKKVIALVVTYNRKELLIKVIDALIKQTYPLEKIIIIDNDSNDGTSEYIADLLGGNVEYRNTGGNLGGAGGFHFEFQVAEEFAYDYLWLMDDDLMPEHDCLATLLHDNPSGITQPVRSNLDGSIAELSPLTYDLANPFKLNPKGMSVRDYLLDNKSPGHLVKIEAIPFEGPLIAREVVKKIGFPEPRFFIFCDDIEYAIKAVRANIDVVCNLNAKAYRLLVNNQGNDLLSWKGYFMLRNLFYLHENYGLNFFVRKKPIILALGYAFSCILKRQFCQLRIIWRAFWDSSNLKNTQQFKPDTKNSAK